MSSGKTYKALVFQSTGSPALMKELEKVTTLPPGHLRIKVLYASINPMDGKFLHLLGNMWKIPEPFVLGFDWSGILLENNSERKDFAVGDLLYGWNFKGGCFSEELVVNADGAIKSTHLPADVASTLGIAYMSAAQPLLFEAKIAQRKNQSIYVAGGTGGVGLFGVLLSRIHGLRVITSGSKSSALTTLRELGGIEVIDHSKEDLVARVLELTSGRGVDIVFDPTYIASSMVKSCEVVAKGGLWIRLGPWSHGPAEIEQQVHDTVQQRGAVESWGGPLRFETDDKVNTQLSNALKCLKEADTLYAEKKLPVVISEVVPFQEKALNHALLQILGSKIAFKAVIKINDF